MPQYVQQISRCAPAISVLRTAIDGITVSHGYTLLFWACTASVTHKHGLPDALRVMMVLIGAFVPICIAWATATLGERTSERPKIEWHPFVHLVMLAGALTMSWIVTDVVGESVAWFFSGFIASSFALVSLAVQTLLMVRGASRYSSSSVASSGPT